MLPPLGFNTEMLDKVQPDVTDVVVLVMLSAEGGWLELVLVDEDESDRDDEVLELVLAEAPRNDDVMVLELELLSALVDEMSAIDVMLVELLEVHVIELTVEELVKRLHPINLQGCFRHPQHPPWKITPLNCPITRSMLFFSWNDFEDCKVDFQVELGFVHDKSCKSNGVNKCHNKS